VGGTGLGSGRGARVVVFMGAPGPAGVVSEDAQAASATAATTAATMARQDDISVTPMNANVNAKT
jgi:hypothetical protein